MSKKGIMLILSLVVSLTIDSSMAAAAVPSQPQTELTVDQKKAADGIAGAIFFDNKHDVERIFNDNFAEALLTYDKPATAINRAINISTAVQKALETTFHDKPLRSLKNPAGTRFTKLIQQYLHDLILIIQKEGEQRRLSPFEELSPYIQAEIVKNLNDKDLAHLAATSSHELTVLKEEMKNRPSFYWRMPLKKTPLIGHTTWINALEFSHNGTFLVSGTDDGSIIEYDVQTHKEKRRIVGHKAAVTSVAISTDNKKIASGSSDQTVRLWNAATGEEINQFVINNQSPVAFSHDSKYLGFLPKRRFG